MSDPIRREALLQIKVEAGLAFAVEVGARQRGMTRSEFIRQAARAQLAADGVLLPPIGNDGPAPHPSAPTLRPVA